LQSLAGFLLPNENR